MILKSYTIVYPDYSLARASYREMFWECKIGLCMHAVPNILAITRTHQKGIRV